MQALITATLRLTTSAKNKGEIIGILRGLIEPTRVETGCVSCGLYNDLHDENEIIWVEEWRTQADLDRHLRSPQYRRILAVFDMSSGQPDIRFSTVVEVKGMLAIEAARGAGNFEARRGKPD